MVATLNEPGQQSLQTTPGDDTRLGGAQSPAASGLREQQQAHSQISVTSQRKEYDGKQKTFYRGSEETALSAKHGYAADEVLTYTSDGLDQLTKVLEDGIASKIDSNYFTTTARGKFVEQVGFVMQIILEQKLNTVSAAIHFDFAKSTLRPEAEAAIKEYAEHIKALDQSALFKGAHIELDAHTDKVGFSDGNLRLSEECAQAVKSELVKYGIDASRITIRSHGDTKPILPNEQENGADNKIGRAANRVVNLRVVASREVKDAITQSVAAAYDAKTQETIKARQAAQPRPIPDTSTPDTSTSDSTVADTAISSTTEEIVPQETAQPAERKFNDDQLRHMAKYLSDKVDACNTQAERQKALDAQFRLLSKADTEVFVPIYRELRAKLLQEKREQLYGKNPNQDDAPKTEAQEETPTPAPVAPATPLVTDTTPTPTPAVPPENKLPVGRILNDEQLKSRAAQLKDAIYGAGTNEDKMRSALDKLSESDGARLRELYKESTGADLEEDIKGEFWFESDAKEHIRLLNGMTYKDKAEMIFEAIDGAGTAYPELIAVLETVKPGEGQLIKDYYEQNYGDLDEDLEDELWDAEVVLCKSLLNGFSVKDRVDALHAAVYGIGTNDDVLNYVLSRSDLVDLTRGYNEDPRHKGTSILKDILGDVANDEYMNDIILAAYPELGPTVVYIRDQIDPLFWTSEGGIYSKLKDLSPEKRKKVIEIYDFFGKEDPDFKTLRKAIVGEMDGELRKKTLALLDESEKK